jgi:hypothetical protein
VTRVTNVHDSPHFLPGGGTDGQSRMARATIRRGSVGFIEQAGVLFLKPDPHLPKWWGVGCENTHFGD